LRAAVPTPEIGNVGEKPITDAKKEERRRNRYIIVVKWAPLPIYSASSVRCSVFVFEENERRLHLERR